MSRPTSLDAQTAVVTQLLTGVHTCMPGEVVRVYGAATEHRGQFVDVQPSLRRQVRDEFGELEQETLPVLPMVPVAYPRGGGFFVALPLAVGDFVTLVFAERSLDLWLQLARAGSGPVDQGDVGTHTLDGAIALPCGPSPRPELLAGVSASDLVIAGPAGVLARFRADGSISLDEGDVPVALAGPSADEFARVESDIAALKHAVALALAACTPLPSAPTPPGEVFTASALGVPSSPGPVAAARVTTR